MRLNLSKIVTFYKTDIGVYVRDSLSIKLMQFCKSISVQDKTIVASGASCFYLDALKQYSNRFALQLYHSTHADLNVGQGHFIECNREYWPYRAENVDGVIMLHDLEFAENPEVYLREAWRVLKGEGRLLLVIPNRSGGWARQDNTPFGQGHPYSMEQIRKILATAHFQIDTIDKALFFPPYEPKTAVARLYRRWIERLDGLFCMNSGVFVIEASKRIYAPTNGLKEFTAQSARNIMMNKGKVEAAGRSHKSPSSRVLD